jgi:hypothetical protein
MIELKDKDFASMKWRIDLVPMNDKVRDTLPDVADIFLEFSKFSTTSLSNDILIRFIVFCYHRKSPFVEKIDNIIERKVAVLNYLKVVDNEGKYPDDIQKILKSSDAKTAKMIYQFCKFEDSLTYFALVTTTETYIAMNERLGEEISSAKDSKDTVDVMIKLDKIEERIDKLADKLFKRDKDLKDFIGSVLVMDGRKKKICPEDYAE